MFLYGFAKSARDNLYRDELLAYRALARVFLGLDEVRIERLIADGELTEVFDGEEV